MDVSTNKKCSFWQTDQSQKFVVLCVLCELPCQTNPRISWVTAWGYIRDIRDIDQFLIDEDKTHFIVKNM